MIRPCLLTASLTSILTVAMLASTGCAASNESDAAEGSDDALTSSAAAIYVGSYANSASTLASGGLFQLKLDTKGSYSALVQPSPPVTCITAPCGIPETGRWSVSTSGGASHLKLRPTGEAARNYVVDRRVLNATIAGDLCGADPGHEWDRRGEDYFQCAPTEECVWECADGSSDCPGVCKPKATSGLTLTLDGTTQELNRVSASASTIGEACEGPTGNFCSANETCVHHMCPPGPSDCAGTCEAK